MPTTTLMPGNYEPEPDPDEVERGIDAIGRLLDAIAVEELVNNRSNVRDVGSGVIAIEQLGVPRSVGRVAGSAYIAPQIDAPPVF